MLLYLIIKKTGKKMKNYIKVAFCVTLFSISLSTMATELVASEKTEIKKEDIKKSLDADLALALLTLKKEISFESFEYIWTKKGLNVKKNSLIPSENLGD